MYLRDDDESTQAADALSAGGVLTVILVVWLLDVQRVVYVSKYTQVTQSPTQTS